VQLLLQPLTAKRAAALLVVAAATLLTVFTPSAVAAGPQQYHGAQTHPLWGGVSVADYDRELALLQEAGADSVRADIGWASLEQSGKGQWSDWYVKRADEFFKRARARGLKVIVTLSDSPCWASSAPDAGDCTGSWWDRGVQKWAPRNPADYADAAAWVAARWKNDLAALEIGNEPNDTAYFKAADPVGEYAAMVKAAYGPIKAVAPELPVVVGAVSWSDRGWLERMYDKGIAGHYDGISIHPYNEWRNPNDAWQPQWKTYSFLSGVKWVRELMVAKGDSDKGLWLTEFGFSTCGTANKVCVDAQQQAEYTKESFRIAAGWSYVRAAMVYNLRNIDDTPNNRLSQFGLVNHDFSPKPAYAAFKEALHAYYGPNATAQPDPNAVTGSPAGSGTSTGTGTSAGAGTATPVEVRGGTVSVIAAPNGAVLTTTARGVTAVKLTCKVKRGSRGKRAKRCKGSLRLRVAGSNSKVGETRFSIPAGKRTVRIKLTKRAQRTIARTGRLRVTATVAPSGASAKAVAARRSFLLARV
jgi:hypothetical protein